MFTADELLVPAYWLPEILNSVQEVTLISDVNSFKVFRPIFISDKRLLNTKIKCKVFNFFLSEVEFKKINPDSIVLLNNGVISRTKQYKILGVNFIGAPYSYYQIFVKLVKTK